MNILTDTHGILRFSLFLQQETKTNRSIHHSSENFGVLQCTRMCSYLVRIPLLSGYSCEILLLNYASDSLLQNHVI